MLSHRVICVGRKAKDPQLESAERYLDRLKKCAKIDLIRLKEGTMSSEGDAILKSIDGCHQVIALDEHGAQWSTMELSSQIVKWRDNGVGTVAWIIGGADGLDSRVKERANRTLSLTKMTLPHRMALALLLEQLYRVEQIRLGTGYHRP